jgi:3-oxoacyl-[acyl-carrier protein] reductase
VTNDYLSAMNLSLEGRNAFVCGSTQGIGRAAAEELARLGARITLIARNEEELKKVQQSLAKDFSQQHDYICADFSNPQELKSKVEKYISANNSIHILINNTGGPATGPITEAKTDEFIAAFNNHLICNHILVQALLPGMKSAGFGRIINVISTSVKQPIRGLGVSNTIRAAVNNWSKTLSMEVAQHGITVNNILPGATTTQRLQSIFSARSKERNISEEEIKKEWLLEIPAGRFGEPQEIANAIAFLASPAASYINGVNLPVDGGRTIAI